MKGIVGTLCCLFSISIASAQHNVLTLQHLSRTIRFGVDLGPQDPLELWQAQDIETTTRQMLAHHNAPWFIADIYARMIGSSINHTQQAQTAWTQLLKFAPQAVVSAISWKNQQNSEPFFRTQTPLVDWTPIVRNQGRILTGQALVKFRKTVFNDAGLFFGNLRDEIVNQPSTISAWESVCKSNIENEIIFKLSQYGVPENVVMAIKRQWFAKLKSNCVDVAPERSPLQLFDELVSSFNKAIDYIQSIPVAGVIPTDLNHILFYSLDSLSLLPSWFQSDQWLSLTNTVSNRNRKRSHFVLQKFFCTKLGIPPPDLHYKNMKSCSTCHRQLDPLAGLFRSIGYHGANFIDQKFIVFDGGSAGLLANYEQYWRDDASPDGWDTGYVDSNGNKTNLANLADLELLLQNHETVRSCWVSHVGKYLWPRLNLAQQQTIDVAQSYAKTLQTKGWQESIVHLVAMLTRIYEGQHD